MFFVYLTIFFLIFVVMKFTKFKEYNQFVYIFLGFSSILFLFKDFKEILDFKFIDNIFFIVPILIIHSFYLLVNNDFKNQKLCNEFHILIYILMIINFQVFLTICLLGAITYKKVLIENSKLEIRRTTILLILVAALSQLNLKFNGFEEFIFIALLMINLFRKSSSQEVYSFGLVFAIISFEFMSIKIFSFILIILNGLNFLISVKHYEIMKRFLLNLDILERIQTILKIKYKPLKLDLRENLVDSGFRVSRKKDYSGLNFDYELFLLLLLFIFMVAL